MSSGNPSLNLSTTPWGFRQCLPFSWTILRGKHCQYPIAVMGVVDTFEHYLMLVNLKLFPVSDNDITDLIASLNKEALYSVKAIQENMLGRYH